MSILYKTLVDILNPFYSPQHLKYLLDVMKVYGQYALAMWISIPSSQTTVTPRSRWGSTILAKDIKHRIRWCLDRIENPDWFFIQDSDEEHQKIPISYLSTHLQNTACHFLPSPTETTLLFTEFQKHLAKLQSTYNDGLLFLRDIDPLFHDDFSILCQVLNKNDGLSQPEIQSAFDNIKPFTKWETELIPETSIKPSLKSSTVGTT